jgi:hypothetical protein
MPPRGTGGQSPHNRVWAQTPCTGVPRRHLLQVPPRQRTWESISGHAEGLCEMLGRPGPARGNAPHPCPTSLRTNLAGSTAHQLPHSGAIPARAERDYVHHSSQNMTSRIGQSSVKIHHKSTLHGSQRYVKHVSEWTRARKHQQKEGSARKDRTAPSVGVNHGIWQLSNGEGNRPPSTWRHLLLIFSSKEWTFTLLSPAWQMYLVWAGLWGLVHWPHMHWAEGSRCVSIRVHACDVSVA